ncbi:MAG: PKD domain-containing protein [Lentimicrobium sp.]|nr:PKD domain-containing protein [Lentimicrobium sp.]
MKRFFKFRMPLIIAFIGTGIILSLTTCKKDEEKKATLPVLTTKTPATITSNSAVLGGFISGDGGAEVTVRGVCYSSLNQNPSVNDFVITSGNGTGNYQCTLPELDSETKYYARAFAMNSAGIGYGNLVSFTTETVIISPTAAFTATPTNGTKPLTVNFTDQSTNNPTSWLWNFGDGSTSNQQNPNHVYNIEGTYTVQLTVTNNMGSDTGQKSNYINVTSSGGTGTVTDIDGNVYQTVIIGTQEWMAENLKVTHYSNGDAIPNVTGDSQWGALTTGAYCWYDNDINWKNAYGALYNWYAAVDSRGLCPVGWHVPTDAEWTILTNYLGGSNVAGGKMKSTRTEPDAHPRWNLPNTGATNESGFSGLPGGNRDYSGTFYYHGWTGFFWSSSEFSSDFAWYRDLYYYDSSVGRNYYYKQNGFSVRCLRD